jgi:DNA-binding Lrp family transcriptional regulator
MEYEITERAIRYRLGRLEKNNIILGYSAILNPGLMISEKVNRTIILRFKFSKDIQVLIDRLKNYVEEAPFCVYSEYHYHLFSDYIYYKLPFTSIIKNCSL